MILVVGLMSELELDYIIIFARSFFKEVLFEMASKKPKAKGMVIRLLLEKYQARNVALRSSC